MAGGDIEVEPDVVATLPIPLSMDAVAAPAIVHESVDVAPGATAAGVVVSEQTGFVTVTVAVQVPDPAVLATVMV